jgi:hypothetical protein
MITTSDQLKGSVWSDFSGYNYSYYYPNCKYYRLDENGHFLSSCDKDNHASGLKVTDDKVSFANGTRVGRTAPDEDIALSDSDSSNELIYDSAPGHSFVMENGARPEADDCMISISSINKLRLCSTYNPEKSSSGEMMLEVMDIRNGSSTIPAKLHLLPTVMSTLSTRGGLELINTQTAGGSNESTSSQDERMFIRM